MISKKLRASLPRHDICRGFKCGDLIGHCFFWITCRQLFTCGHCWATRAACAEPHASRWISRSVRQQTVPVFNALWEQKLINGFNYCLQKHYHWNYITLTSLSCQAGIAFCWNKWGSVKNWKL